MIFSSLGQGHNDKKRIHTMAAVTTDSPYGGHAFLQTALVLFQVTSLKNF